MASRRSPLAAESPPRLLGIVNATPDSFSGDGRGSHAAIARGLALIDEGAAMLDVGGESTRPGASPVAVAEEIARILPVVRALAPRIPVSIDTRNAATMRAALDAGATVINDVTALRHDPAAMAVAREAACPIILMHMPGTDPRTMQLAPSYADVFAEVRDFLLERAALLTNPVWLDPGIGFGKTLAHNLELLRRLPELVACGLPVVLGASRKSFIGRVDRGADRLPGSLAAALVGAGAGVAWLRVHDVAQTRQAVGVWHAIHASSLPPQRLDITP